MAGAGWGRGRQGAGGVAGSKNIKQEAASAKVKKAGPSVGTEGKGSSERYSEGY